jgi:hypothetical protein
MQVCSVILHSTERNMDDIVKYGKELFALYYKGGISIAVLEEELMSKAPVLSFNDFAVLGCYCEKDCEVTLILHRIQNIKTSKEMLAEVVVDNGMSPKMSFIMLCNAIDKSAKPLDAYFHCHKFVPMVVQVWKESWGTNWESLIASGEETVEKLPFLKPILDDYLR